MPSTQTILRTRKPVDYGTTPGTTTINRRFRELYRKFANVVTGQLAGDSGDGEYVLGYSASDPAAAVAGLAISGGSGAVGAIINGVTVTVAHGASDTVDGAAISNALNTSVNALVQGFVQANNLTATLTCTSVVAGDQVIIGSTPFTAITGTAPNLVSGASNGTFDRSGTNAQTATNLAAAINAAPVCNRYFMAIAVSNVVRLFARTANYSAAAGTYSFPTGPGVPPNFISPLATTIVASAGALVAGAFVGISTPLPGIYGNAVTIALSGTGVTVLNAATRFAGGVGPNVFINSAC